MQLLDVLRGFAIFGMFAVNMGVDNWGPETRAAQLAMPDFLILVFLDVFGQKKFLTIFTFLFGIGFLVQVERFRVRGVNHVGLYVRRSIGLFLIGTLAIACTLPSGILSDYATYGLVLLLFYKCSPQAILVVAVLCFGLEAFTVLVPKYQASLEIEFLAAEPDVVAVSMSPLRQRHIISGMSNHWPLRTSKLEPVVLRFNLNCHQHLRRSIHA